MNIIDAVKNTAFATAVHTVLDYLEKDPERNTPKAIHQKQYTKSNKAYGQGFVGWMI